MKFITNANISVWIKICRCFLLIWFTQLLCCVVPIFYAANLAVFTIFFPLFLLSLHAYTKSNTTDTNKLIDRLQKMTHTEKKNEMNDDDDVDAKSNNIDGDELSSRNQSRGETDRQRIKRAHHNQFVAVRQMVCLSHLGSIMQVSAIVLRCNWCAVIECETINFHKEARLYCVIEIQRQIHHRTVDETVRFFHSLHSRIFQSLQTIDSIFLLFNLSGHHHIKFPTFGSAAAAIVEPFMLSIFDFQKSEKERPKIYGEERHQL